VIYHGGRPLDPSRSSATDTTRRVDSLVHGVTPMTTLPGRVIGAKPAAFSRWMFNLLGAQPGDTFEDLFPGSGAVTRAWTAFTASADPSREAPHDGYQEETCSQLRAPHHWRDSPHALPHEQTRDRCRVRIRDQLYGPGE
jgi:hypothetical protein